MIVLGVFRGEVYGSGFSRYLGNVCGFGFIFNKGLSGCFFGLGFNEDEENWIG